MAQRNLCLRVSFVLLCETALLRRALQHDVEDASLKSLPVNTSFFNCDRVLDAIHRIALLRVAGEMNLGDERLISWTHREHVKVRAAPELRRARRIGPVGNRANAFELVETSLG